MMMLCGSDTLVDAVDAVVVALDFDLRRQPKIKTNGNVNGVGQE